jgi:hypothetical protein
MSLLLAQSGHRPRARQCPLMTKSRTWHVYRHAMTEFLFDLNQIQNFRL